ncbi:1-acyl-sn-glycerol-3-phosphate acyltransferase [Ferrovibrio sp.]|uniref:1-acyl-sn-glycerol-3-phosphate acyltransferase n=1 Tax=Ferrovibrio sp. TaxID=1917215 RepID=UPI001B7CC69E|nr:1-acyl-sn-glycerol-3-phosphate acyltransferase [Ferrovibrio sp.]MBP7065143.1 1-acyl-sn-glycerol-3-phosphate acyltransferase [Ferrovibrio sp.]
MQQTIEIPLWFAILAAVLALIGLADRLLVPGVRWFLRRRLNRVIDDLNQRLQLKLRPITLTRRQSLIDRLLYDPQVVAAAEAHAAEHEMPREVAMAQVERYAREIVPAFNAYFYFRIGYWLARRLARSLYRVRVGYTDAAGLDAVPRDATVVFVMNHRSNMDYVLVAYLAADQAALSYAVGEWARVWPLQQLIRAMGAYFIRRNSNDPLYRKVLERYVQTATAGGVPQAIFPEGGLTLDGRMRAPKLGLLDYLARAFDPVEGRDVVFVPVGINYDRVLEDRSLLRKLDPEAKRVGATAAIGTMLRFAGRNLLRALEGRWYRFGYACVNFGTPLSLRAWLQQCGAGDLRLHDKAARAAHVAALGAELMSRVGAVVPVLPTALVSQVLLDAGEAGLSALEVKARCQALIERLQAGGARIYVPRGDLDYGIETGLRMFGLRRILSRDMAGLYRANPADAAILRYYANSIVHLLP